MNKIIMILLLMTTGCAHQKQLFNKPSPTAYKYEKVEGRNIFYREAGNPKNPTVLLLHGFPSSSHTYRKLIPMLSGKYHVIAPDNLGSGFSNHPNPKNLKYTFDLLSEKIDGLLRSKNITQYYIYMQDFGAPVGYRLALKRPERILGLIVQNANAYLEGLSSAKKNFFLTAGDKNSKFPVSKLYNHVSESSIKNKQYLRDIPKNKEFIMSPDTWTHDLVFLKSKVDKTIQVQLFQDYRTNLKAYPKWQEYLRKYQPRTLIVWGKKDPVFMHTGATAYLKDVPNAELHLIDAGHFALEEKPYEIAELILNFLSSK